MMKLPVGMQQADKKGTPELPPDQMVPVVRVVKATQDGVEYQISMWTPFPGMRDGIMSDTLQHSIEGLVAANVMLKDTSPFPAPKPDSHGP
jgi:hypothetical protein